MRLNRVIQFDLRTTDAGGLTFEKQVTISVTNVNEAPTSLTLSNNSIAENSGVNGIIGTFTSTDPDVGDTKTYALTSGVGDVDNSQFTIVGDKLQLNPNPNFEAKSSYQLRVKVTDAGGLSYQQAFVVNITDLNEAPTNLTIDKSNIDENSAANSVIGNFSTTDPDFVDTASYTLVAGTGDVDNSKFVVAGNKLQIKQSPDFETQSSYSIRVRTTDKGGLIFDKVLAIGVNNLNEAPTSLILSNNTVAENTGVNGVIGTFTSTDPDLGDTKTYSLTSGLGDIDNSQFTIVGDKLQLKPNPDFETKSTYQLRAKVTDAGGLSYEQAFNVNISDVNEAPTNITIDKSNIDENSPANSVVGNLTTIDPDLVDTASYTLVAGTGDADNSKFAIAGNKLQINQSPDFETKSSYSIRIRTTDKGGLTLDKVLTIGVKNLNEAPTSLILSNNTVAENIGINGVIGTFTSTDPDLGDTRTYTLTTGLGDIDNSQFTIVGDKLQLNPNPNFEAKSSYQLRVKVTDAGGLSYQQAFTVNISDVNEAPTNLAIDKSNIDENSAANTVVGNLTTTDPDLVDTASYTLVVGTGSTDNSKFAIVGNKLQINQSPDFETQSSYSIRIRTTDKGGLTYEKQLTIGVNNLNEAPTSLALSNNTVAENTGVNGVIGTFTSTDPDVGDTRTYALTSGLGDTDNSQFTIVGDKLQLNPNPNFEAKSTYQLRVKVTDAGGLSYQQAFTVNITDVNEAPTNLAIDKSNIDENSPANSIVGNFTTTDPDLVDTASYTLVAGTGDLDNTKFAIAGNKLQIDQSPDFETQSSYSIRIRTTDKGGLTYEKQLTIGVNNLNEAPTSLNLSNNTVAENIGLNGVIGIFTSTDPDLGDTKTYSLTSGLGDIDNSQFTIVGDKLQLKPNPDFETKSTYQLRAKVTDAGGLSYEKAFTVNITDVNEAPTNLTIDKSNIDENSLANSIVGNLTTTDPDLVDTASYTLVAGAGSTDNSKFAIVGNKLQINQSPDFETQSSYSIRIRTTDKGGLILEKVLTIGVNNVNEAPTSLILSNSNVAENIGSNSVIGTFTSTDPDLGDTKTYTLTSGLGDIDNSQFTIVSDKLQLKPNPDFETKSTYQLRVKVTDAGGLSYQQAFTVNISDVNEAPTNLAIDKSNIDENSAANSVIGNLTTTDSDLVDTASYTLVAGTTVMPPNRFSIRPKSKRWNHSAFGRTSARVTSITRAICVR